MSQRFVDERHCYGDFEYPLSRRDAHFVKPKQFFSLEVYAQHEYVSKRRSIELHASVSGFDCVRVRV